ncbi:hypothetical protein [Campylobacter insulaenigrae]|uniref:hypothetical protein n=1 Tax=Campylobacter insulaenigrae TaxID=260714 RepID=UPI0021531533|nr:hypothetical protein [Campylobacter insulaenigrae]MCR6574515.1 hypothetical protein [Campylobacter insulaenigrae]MCR6580441.1 hypothetical protein [Campylobacter insulaenigrae]MCR6585476.1 hypothetical protein [Campylobacter insulaenigrae]
MFLEITFDYKCKNDIFEYLLLYYAQDYSYVFEQKDNKIIIKISGEKEYLQAFCENLEKISHSIFLDKFDLKIIEEELEILKPVKKDFTKRSFLTRLNANAYIHGELVENEWEIFVEEEFKIENDFMKITKENFHFFLEKSLEKLKNKQKIEYKNDKGIYALEIFNETLDDFLMPSDPKHINAFFSCNNEQFKILAGLEKPLMKLKFNAIFRQNHNIKNDYFKIKIYDNLFIFALCYELNKEGIKFLNFKKLQHFEDDFEVALIEKNMFVLKGFDYILPEFKNLIFQKEDKNYARISCILSDFKDKKPLLLELSKKYDDIILLDKQVNLLKLKLPTSFDEFYEVVKQDETAKRLLENYQKEFVLPQIKLNLKNNFFGIFCMIGIILELDKDPLQAGMKVLSLSDESKIAKGVRIDFKFNDQKEFDYTKTLRSVMSFKLAGVEDQIIALGAIESLAYCLRDMFDDLKAKNQADFVVLSGSLFEHKSLSKNIFKHIPFFKISDVPLWI